MQESYPDKDLQFDDILCHLNIFINREGEISYTCDWEKSEEGIVSISSVFFKSIYKDLLPKIFQEIKNRCVLDNNEDINSISRIVEQMIKEDEDIGGNFLGGPPTKV